MTGAEAGASDSADREAMARLVRGEDEALREIVDRHGPAVLKLLERLVADHHDALDLCQETFLRVHRYRADYDPDRPFRIWLYTIAANLGRNVLRARRRFLRVPFESHGWDPDEPSIAEILAADGSRPDEAAEATERKAAVRQAMDRLSPDLRSAVVLVDLQDMSVKEAAAVLRLSPRTVESRLYHARRLLRERLARWLRPTPTPGALPFLRSGTDALSCGRISE